MLKLHNVQLVKDCFLTTPIEDESLLHSCRLDNFDREGYELLPIEQEFYKAQGIALTEKDVIAKETGGDDSWHAAILPWFDQPDYHDSIYLDHSYCCTAYQLAGDALEQVKRAARTRPELWKFVHAFRKWGTDFCIDYMTEHDCIELVHWEWDFLAYEWTELEDHLYDMQQRVLATDWEHFAKLLMRHQSEWVNLNADDQGDYKSKYFGLDQAFKSKKRL
jgi:hypothetical protein